MSGRAVRPAHRATTRTKPPLPCASAGQELFGGVLLQSGAGGARTLIAKAVHNPVALISQAPVKALAVNVIAKWRGILIAVCRPGAVTWETRRR